MPTILTTKQLLRKEIKKKLFELTPTDRQQQSVDVVQKFLATSTFERSQRLAIFLSTIGTEIDTDPIIKTALKHGKTCFVPRCHHLHMSMVRLRSVNDLSRMPTNRWGIREPALDDEREDALKTGGLDLIIVPALAFDRQCHRLGKGRGYYDRFIKHIKCLQKDQEPITIGLAFREQILDTVPIEEHDVKIDFVLHPDGLIENQH